MLVLRTPKGWTGPEEVDGVPVENSWRSHQVPLSQLAEKNDHLQLLEQWMRSYKPEELFTAEGKLKPELRELAPVGKRRMGDNPHANGGALLRELRLPDFREYAIELPAPGSRDRRVDARARQVPARRDEAQHGHGQLPPVRAGRIHVQSLGRSAESHIAHVGGDRSNRPIPASPPDGRVMEMLSEHQCQGWLEGYLLTGRHGFFSCYEAFIHIVDSMFNQHAKWLKTCNHIGWRRPIASLNYLLTSHVWRQDHNGFSHQDPGLHRSRGEQESRRHPRVSAARRQYAVERDRSLPAQSQLRERRRCRQTAAASVAVDGRGDQTLQRRRRHLVLGQQRSGRRAGHRHGLRGRCADVGNIGGGVVAARVAAGAAHSRRERRRPDDAAAGHANIRTA